MAEAHVPVRVLPSGKVYRQMFDAEVQLVNSLQASKNAFSRLPVLPASKNASRQVRPPTDLLTPRQKLWTVGMPNDYSTENPVTLRQVTAEAAGRLSEYEQDPHVTDVQRLPNDIRKIDHDSSVIEKISKQRKERHGHELDKMHIELSTITTRVEPRIAAIGEHLKTKLEQDDKEIEEIFSQIEKDEDIVNFSIELLEKLWEKADRHSPMRVTWIENADANYSIIENERFDAMSGVFRKYAAVLEKIAFLMPVNVQRYVEKESMMANQGILANRRAYAKLRINLLESEIQRKMTLYLTWTERVEHWKKLNIKVAIKQFEDFMTSDQICDPPEVDELTNKFVEEQKVLEGKRREILQQLLEFKPPTSTKTSVYKWNSALTKTQENIDQLHLKWIRCLNEKFENVCQRCLTEIEKYRQNLVISKVCNNETMQQIVNEHMLPLVGEQQRMFESKLEEMDQLFESLALRTETQLKGMFKFVQGAAHLWDVHEIGLAKQERNLQIDLDESRQEHDVVNQERESKLDITLDRLRQESTEEALSSFLQKSLEFLEFIYSGYKEFNQQQLSIINRYPDMVGSEIRNYDDAVCKFFKVDRKTPGSEDSVSRQTRDIEVSNSQRELAHYSPVEETSKVLRDTITTKKGTSFYVVTALDEEDLEEQIEEDETDGRKSSAMSGRAFMTEISVDGEKKLASHVSEVYMSSTVLYEYKKHIRLHFLEHLELWSDQVRKKSEDLSRDKREELASELDLRKHLHEPRAKRIEVDVHNVRAAELVLHKERVSRHCKGISAALLGLKEGFIEMTKEHESLAAEFKDNIEGMETVFINSTKAAKLVELSSSLHDKLDSYMQIIKASLRRYRQTLDGTLSHLRDSNAQCLKSFKLFSQGGNFSPEETVDLRKKLEKMSHRVDIAEGAIMQDMEGMESKRLDHATDIVLKFEDRFRNHMVDLTFIERVQRWITNSQVRIKTEVQHCNGMGVNISRHVKLIKSRVDACKFPNPDKEEISTAFLQQYADEVMKCLQERADYLNCHLQVVETEGQTQASGVDISEPANPDKPVSRQSLVSQPTSKQSVRKKSRVSTPGKGSQKHSSLTPSRTELLTGGSLRKGQPQEDSAIGMIKSILKTRSGSEQETEDARSVLTSGRQMLSTAASQSAMARLRRGSAKRRGTLSSITGSIAGSDKGRKKDTDSRTNSSNYRKRDTKFDARHMVFGSERPKGMYFESKVQAVLYDTLDGLLSIGELYYKQKGTKSVTRPQHIQDSFDSYSDVIVAKLVNYESQTKEFHNIALQEFRQQLKEIEEDLAELPYIVLDEILRNNLKNLHQQQQSIKDVYAARESDWEKSKGNHKNILRPTLGHQNQQEILQDLIKKEEDRQEENVTGIHDNAVELKIKAYDVTKNFIFNISQTCTKLLEQFSRLITIDDVNTGQIEIKRESTSILLRKKAAGIDLHDTSYKPSLLRGPKQWHGMDIKEFPEDKDLSEVSEDIDCTKTTLSHISSIKKRDECVREFMKAYTSLVTSISRQEELQLDAESRWRENWVQSVKNVRELYET